MTSQKKFDGCISGPRDFSCSQEYICLNVMKISRHNMIAMIGQVIIETVEEVDVEYITEN